MHFKIIYLDQVSSTFDSNAGHAPVCSTNEPRIIILLILKHRSKTIIVSNSIASELIKQKLRLYSIIDEITKIMRVSSRKEL